MTTEPGEGTGGPAVGHVTRGDGWAITGLVALVAFVVREPLLFGRAFYERDIQTWWQPQLAGFVRAIRAGAWPVWDPNISFGHPLLAQPNTQAAYPPAWLCLLLEPSTCYAALVGLHLLVGLLGVYGVARRYGLSPLGGFAAAAVWGGSGPYLSLIIVWHHLMAASWMPWALLAAEAAFESPRASRALLLGGVLSAQMLAGSPDVTLMTAALLAVVAFSHALRRWPPRLKDGRSLVRLATAYLVAAGLSAVLWVPALEVARRAERWVLPGPTQTYWSLHPAALPLLALPLFMMDLPLRPEIRAALFESREPFLYSVYIGMPAAALAVASFTGRARRRRLLLAGIALGALLTALGRYTPFYAGLSATFPPIRMIRYPSKALVLAALAGSLLAGMGVEAWRDAALSRRRRLLLGLSLLVMVAAGSAALLLTRADGDRIASRLFLPAPAAGAEPAALLAGLLPPLVWSTQLTAVVLAAAALATWKPSLAPGTAALAVALAVGELFFQHRQLNPTAPRELLRYRPPHAEAMLARPLPRVWTYVYDDAASLRYLGHPRGLRAEAVPRDWPYALAQAFALRMYGPPPLPSQWGISGSFDADPLGMYPQALQGFAALPRAVEGTPGLLRLLQLGAVTHVVALHERGLEPLIPIETYPSLFKEPIRLFGVPDPLPRSYVVSGARIADGPAALALLLDPDLDPRREVVLPAGDAVSPAPGFIGTSRITVWTPDFVRIEAELNHPGFVVLVDTHDPGWRARVDGRPAPLLRANVAFRAVRVLSGRHLVELRYRPAALIAGLAVSGASLAGVLAWLLTCGRRPA